MINHRTDLGRDQVQDEEGLSVDLSTMLRRRRFLQVFGGVGVLTLAGCASGAVRNSATSAAPNASSVTSATSTSPASRSSVSAIPDETAGPYPGDGSNGVNVLTESGIVRSDIRSSFGSATGTADGVPATVRFTVLDTANGGAPLAGAAVYVWHCDREGGYSLYSNGITNENFLRGVQETDASGVATFTSIYPGCYSGRWPHIHFEVYPSLAEATAAGSKLATSQIALTADASNLVYATDGYTQSARNFAQTSLATDMVFSDGAELETPTVTGSVTDGLTIALNVGV